VLAATNTGLVNFDMARETVITIDYTHEFANLMARAARGFVHRAKLSLEFLAWHTVAGRGEPVDRAEPKVQRCAAPLKGRPGARINMMAAELAAICKTVRKAVVFSCLATLQTIPINSVAQHHDVLRTSIVIGEVREEVLYSDFHGFSAPESTLPKWLARVYGIHPRVQYKLMSA
jgi:hypothetical protein